MYLGISGNNQRAEMLSVWDCCCFLVAGWLCLFQAGSPWSWARGRGAQRWERGFRLFTGDNPGMGAPPARPALPCSPGWTWAPRGVLDASALLLQAWAWRAACHVVLGAVVVHWSWESMMYTPTRETHLLMSSQVAAPSGCSAGGPGIQTPAPGRGAFVTPPSSPVTCHRTCSQLCASV